jgi:uncharacterized protein
MIEAKTMVQVEEMDEKDCQSLLQRVSYGHLGLVKNNHPYVVPIHFAFEKPHIYIFTTEGKKTDIIENNPEICLQLEQLTDEKHWQSVIVIGNAVKVIDAEETKRVMQLILATNPNLTPALSIRWMDQWIRENIEIVYQITPNSITGRMTVDRLRSSR